MPCAQPSVAAPQNHSACRIYRIICSPANRPSQCTLQYLLASICGSTDIISPLPVFLDSFPLQDRVHKMKQQLDWVLGWTRKRFCTVEQKTEVLQSRDDKYSNNVYIIRTLRLGGALNERCQFPGRNEEIG